MRPGSRYNFFGSHMTLPARNGPAITATARPRNLGQASLVYRSAAAVQRSQAPGMGAPPVYRPAPPVITAPPAYRPNVPLQPKLAGSICGPQTCAPGVAQKRNRGDALCSNQPAPPPVYRPQTLPVSAPAKPLTHATPRKLPAVQPVMGRLVAKHLGAPPVYRPHPTKLVQPKVFLPQQKLAPAPPVYRPEQQNMAQPMLATPATVQRTPNAAGGALQAKHKTKDGTYTKNRLYYVAANNPFELYTDEDAKPPQPASIFDEVFTWYPGWLLWRPKVQFLTKAVTASPDDREDEVTKQFKSLKKQKGYIYGKNDCEMFASLVSGIYSRDSKDKEEDTNIGDIVKVTFDKSECGYHAAPIVATDGGDIVTLEGNVADKGRERPHFAIYEGLQGFISEQEDVVKGSALNKKVDGSTVGEYHLWSGKDDKVGSEGAPLFYQLAENLIYYDPSSA